MFQYQLRPVFQWFQSEFWWIYPEHIKFKSAGFFICSQKAHVYSLFFQHLQNERSCHSSQSWHYHKPPAEGWLQRSDPQESPAWEHLSYISYAFKLALLCQTYLIFNNQFYLHFASCSLSLLSSNSCNCCKVLDDTLGVDSLSGTGFSTGLLETHYQDSASLS